MSAAAQASPFLASIVQGHSVAAAGLAAPAATEATRRAALERFVAAGLPTGRDENWKYLTLRSLGRHELDFAAQPARVDRLPEAALALTNATRLVFVNGRLDSTLSTALAKTKGVRIEPLTEVYRRQPELLASAMPEDDRADSRFALLNTAFVADGASIEIDGAAAPLIHVLNLATGSEPSFPRLRIRAADGASGVIVEQHLSDAAGARFVNSLAEIEVEGDSRIELCRVHALGTGGQEFDTLRARVGAGSSLALHCLGVGGDLLRSDIDVALVGPSAAAQVRSLLFTSGSQHHELHAEIRHSVPDTHSRTEVRTVVNDGGRAICNSKVVVAPGACRSISEQNFRNLLLASGAEADTRPQLEIHNEDVKCSHGASTGRLDANMLFYLTSRGIDAPTARALLTYAFVLDILQALPVAALTEALAGRIAGELPARDLIKEFI
jgi:Fe-S cluster assembly protein SufD